MVPVRILDILQSRLDGMELGTAKSVSRFLCHVPFELLWTAIVYVLQGN